MTDLENRILLLEAEIKALADAEAIRQILARYGPLADSADTAERRGKAGALFSQSGIYDLGEEWSACGPENIGELLNNPEHLELMESGSAHVMGIPYIELNGDSASATSYSRVYRHQNGEFKVWRVSVNRWECERIEGQWKVLRRINRLLNGSEEARALLRKVE